jgi:hypothetical protein
LSSGAAHKNQKLFRKPKERPHGRSFYYLIGLLTEISPQQTFKASAVTSFVARHLADGVSHSTKYNVKQEKTLFDNVFYQVITSIYIRIQIANPKLHLPNLL